MIQRSTQHSAPQLVAAMEEDGSWGELPEAAWQRMHSRDASLAPSPASRDQDFACGPKRPRDGSISTCARCAERSLRFAQDDRFGDCPGQHKGCSLPWQNARSLRPTRALMTTCACLTDIGMTMHLYPRQNSLSCMAEDAFRVLSTHDRRAGAARVSLKMTRFGDCPGAIQIHRRGRQDLD